MLKDHSRTKSGMMVEISFFFFFFEFDGNVVSGFLKYAPMHHVTAYASKAWLVFDPDHFITVFHLSNNVCNRAVVLDTAIP